MSHRVAILGAGIGAKHLDGYLALGDRFEVVAVCDLNADLAASEARRAGARPVDDIAKVLADDAVDLVDICLPPRLHAPIAQEALAAGKHVICEKPIAGSVNEAESIAQTAAETGRQFFPVFQYRYGPAFVALKALREAGLLGAAQVGSLETHWSRDAAYYANGWRGTWRHEMGGAILTHAIHAHDLVTQAFGPVAKVSAMLATRINPIETEDCGAAILRTQAGALVTSSITLGAANDTSRLRLVYSQATLESGASPYTPCEVPWRITARHPARDQSRIDAIVREVADAPCGFAGLLADIADALEGRANDAPTMTDGITSIELATAFYHAHRSGECVTLPLDRALPICRGFAPVAT